MNNSGVFFAEKVPEDKKKIVCAAEGLCQKIMCAPKDATQEDVELEAGPSGTSRGWRFDEEREDGKVQCKDDPDRVHWSLWC